ncbi:MAG: glycosyltransferase [Thermoleophilia bacterium]|nr:glycosyltransferase [Thermoleophilia bacterium]
MTGWGAVSVAISTRERADALARCLDALLSGTAPPAEVVVVDQSAGDETRAVVEARSGRGATVVYVRHAAQGLSASQNEAVRSASNAVVAVLDDDCVPAADWVERIAAAFSRPSLDVLTGPVLPLGADLPERYAVASRTGKRARTFGRWAAPWAVGSGNNFALRRAWYEGVGGCDERLGAGSPGGAANDMDLFYRLLRAGARIQYDPALVVFHERKTRAERLGRRFPYGFGMGAACAIWVREGDPNAGLVFVRWLGLRSRRAARALVSGRFLGVREEALVLRGTLAGLRYGVGVARAPRRLAGGGDAGGVASQGLQTRS